VRLVEVVQIDNKILLRRSVEAEVSQMRVTADHRRVRDRCTVAGILSWSAGTLAPLAGPSWQPAQVGVGGLSGLDADPAVDGLDAVGAGDDGAQLELSDLRQVIGDPGDPQQHILE
jgi:hypothetical protein